MNRGEFNKLAAVGMVMLLRACRPKTVTQWVATETLKASTPTPRVEESVIARSTKKATIEPEARLTPIRTQTAVKRAGIDWGIFTGEGIEGLEKIERKVGKRSNLLATFVAWEDEATITPEIREYAKEKDKKLIVFWEAYEPGKEAGDDSKYACEMIRRGNFDKYIQRFAKDLKESGVPTTLFPFPEVNGNWTPQSLTINGNRGKFIDSYRHVSEMFFDVPNVRMGLALNSQSVPNETGNQLDDYFPGRRWVEVAGLDGFNFGPPNEQWRSFDDIFRPALETTKRWDVEVMISSVGCAPSQERAKWFEEAMKTVKGSEYQINGIHIFAQNKAGQGDYERDWSLDEATLKVLQRSLG